MKKASHLRFWLETGLAALTALTSVITLVRPAWIELVFHIDPDAGRGSLERSIVSLLLLLTILFIVLAQYEWRSMQSE
jgi:hypothetical protein